MKKVLNTDFFNRDTLIIVEELLGKYLVLNDGKKEKAFMICEVEAYDGPQDLASHASKGKTSRTDIMFGSAGYFYIYLVYGMYWMLNIVVGPKDYPAAILIRGVVGITGPGRLTKRLGVDKRFHGKLANKKTGLWFEDRGTIINPSQIKKTPRIGVDYAGPIWSKKNWRYVLVIK